MSNRWRIALGVLAGVYALAQAGFLIARVVSDKPPPATPQARAYASGVFLGGVIGILVGSAVCAYMLQIVSFTASRRRSQRPAAKADDPAWGSGQGRREWERGRSGDEAEEL